MAMAKSSCTAGEGRPHASTSWPHLRPPWCVHWGRLRTPRRSAGVRSGCINNSKEPESTPAHKLPRHAYLSAWDAGDAWTFHPSAGSGSAATDAAELFRREQARVYRRRSRATEMPPPPVVLNKLPSQLQPAVLANALLLLDKPKGWSQDEVIRTLKQSLRTKSLVSACHLDMLATGLMAVCVGKAAKFSAVLQDLEQSYSATLRLGEAPEAPYDAASSFSEVVACERLMTAWAADAVSRRLVGGTLQVAPLPESQTNGAKGPAKTAGPATGELPRLQPVYVSRLSAQPAHAGSRDAHVSVTIVGRSTFIRPVAHDFGRTLGTSSDILELRRESIGPFQVQDAWTLEVLLPLLKRYRR